MNILEYAKYKKMFGSSGGGSQTDYYDTFWDEFQQNGARKDYQGGFYGIGWNDTTFKPKYDITNPINTASMFYASKITDLEALIQRAGIKFSTSTAQRVDTMFQFSTITVVPEIDVSNLNSVQSLRYLFGDAKQLHTIRKLIVNADCRYENAFSNTISLQNITFEGTIANDINFQQSPLSGESAMNIIEHLYQVTYAGDDPPLFDSGERTIYFNDDTWARAEQFAIARWAESGQDFIEMYSSIRDYVEDKGWNT